MTAFDHAKSFLLNAAGCPGGKATFGIGEFGYAKLYCAIFQHEGAWVMYQAISKGDGFTVIHSSTGKEEALRWAGHFEHDVFWYEPVYFCHCCKTLLTPIWQSPIVKTKPGFNFLTCDTEDCGLAGQTFTDRSYPMVKLADYIAKA